LGSSSESPFTCLPTYNSKAIPVNGSRDLYGSEMSRVPHCLDNRLTDGGEVVSLTLQPHSSPQKHFLVLVSVTG
jgi:hypothetical protein